MDVCTLLSIYNYYAGKPCILCSTSVFMEGYRAQNSNGVLRPALLIAQLPKINESFGPGMQQCAAEFFLDFTRSIGYNLFTVLREENYSIKLRYFFLGIFPI